VSDRDHSKQSRRNRRNARTTKFLESLSGGPMSLGQLLAALREADGESLAQFSRRLGISRQHLHQIEIGQKRVSPERSARFAKLLGQSEVVFVKLALQDLADDAGLSVTVEVRVA